MSKRAIIFLNGRHQKPKIIKYYLTKKSFLICADGAGNYLRKLNILPDIIIGDLDSVKPENLNYFRKNGTRIKKISEQETTDFEKSLNYAISKGFGEIIIFGATSDRTDHTLNNFSVLKRYHKESELKIIDNFYEIFFVKSAIALKCKTGETVSLFAFPVAKKITTDGLIFPLKNETLSLGIREGTLNQASSENINISFADGDLLLFKQHHLK